MLMRERVGFREMVREKRSENLDTWLNEAQASGVTTLRTFAKGMKLDYTAVRAALESPWSNGQIGPSKARTIKGQGNRLKMIKRQMYGRANFDLLRQRVLFAP